MIVVYSIIAIFIAWIWIDYFRLIDIFEKENLVYVTITFLFGGMSAFFVIALNQFFLDGRVLQLDGIFANDFIISVIKVGAVEEFAKLIPFLIVFLFLRKEFNEPIDYLVFLCASALGFSAVENILFFKNHESWGVYLINGRAILSTVSHMFDTSLMAYGIILYQYRPKYRSVFVMLLFFFFAALSHGLYDYWLQHIESSPWGFVFAVFYFFYTISLFAVILNNSLNNSGFFSYKKIINSHKVAERLLIYYSIVFLMQFILLYYIKGLWFAVIHFSSSLMTVGLICVITSVRLSRFKLIKGRWQKLKIELPFYFPYGIFNDLSYIKIKGDTFNEASVNAFYKEFFYLSPFTPRNTYLGRTHLAYIEKKIFLKGDQTFYVVKVFQEDEKGAFTNMLLKPKMKGSTMTKGAFPIVGILETDDMDNLAHIKTEDCRFLEWGIMKPMYYVHQELQS